MQSYHANDASLCLALPRRVLPSRAVSSLVERLGERTRANPPKNIQANTRYYDQLETTCGWQIFAGFLTVGGSDTSSTVPSSPPSSSDDDGSNMLSASSRLLLKQNQSKSMLPPALTGASALTPVHTLKPKETIMLFYLSRLLSLTLSVFYFGDVHFVGV